MPGSSDSRFASIGTKLAVRTALLLSLFGLILYAELIDREWQSLVEAKERSARMVADLLAASLVGPLDFGDVRTVEGSLTHLGHNGDVVYAVVLAEGRAAPLAELHPDAALPDGGDVHEGRVIVRRVVADPTGKRLGTAVVHFSLAPESSALASAKRRLLGWALALTATVVALMVGLNRRFIVRPLQRLADATRALEAGRAVRVPVGANDEIGRLGSAFNSMAAAIVDRDRLRAERSGAVEALARSERRSRRAFEESSDLIVLVGPDGILKRVSGSSRRLIGYAPAELEGTSVTGTFHADDLAGFASRAAEIRAHPGVPIKGERRVRCKDGSWLWFEFTSTNHLGDPDLGAIVVTGHEITARMAAAAELRELNEQLERQVVVRTRALADLYNRAPCGYFTLGAGSQFLRVNDTLLDWLGHAREELVGQKQLEDVTAPPSLAAVRRWFDGLGGSEGTVEDLELALVRKDGTVLPASLYASVLTHDDFEPTELLVTVVDITDRKRAEAKLLRSHEELRVTHAALARASRAKDGFLAAMSHELRTPLNAVLGLSEALQERVYGPLSEAQCGALARVDASGQLLLALIADILDLTKIEAGARALQIVRVSLEEVCRASLRMIEALAQRKRIAISLRLPEGLPAIEADERSLTQILLNLLGNAVKFTPEGGSLGVEVTAHAGGEELRITVWDTGIGIAREDQARLFQPFVQLDESVARRHVGTGLGLALARRLAELHGGDVSVASEPGQGSRFSVVLPTRRLRAAGADRGADPR